MVCATTAWRVCAFLSRGGSVVMSDERSQKALWCGARPGWVEPREEHGLVRIRSHVMKAAGRTFCRFGRREGLRESFFGRMLGKLPFYTPGWVGMAGNPLASASCMSHCAQFLDHSVSPQPSVRNTGCKGTARKLRNTTVTGPHPPSLLQHTYTQTTFILKMLTMGLS